MDNLSEEARQSRPKKPLNAYFKFRAQKMQEFKDFEDRTTRFKDAWDHLDEGIKQKMQNDYQIELEEYKVKFQEWRAKFEVNDADLGRRKAKQVHHFRSETAGLSLAQAQKWQQFRQTGNSFMRNLAKQFEQKLKQFQRSQVREKLKNESEALSYRCKNSYEQMCQNLKDNINSIISEAIHSDDSGQS